MASSSELPPSKRRQIAAEVANASGTRIGAARVLKLLHRRGLLVDNLGTLTERTLRRAAGLGLEEVAAAETPYGRLVQDLLVNGTKIEIVHPCALIYYLAKTYPKFFRLLCPGERNGHKYIVLYIDEVRPGNPLRPDKARQTQCIYYTFTDFPDDLLVNAETWFLFTVVRSTIVDEIPGKVSALMAGALNIFFGPGQTFARGVLLSNGNAAAMLTAEFSGFMADIKALTEIFSLKSAAGAKPCNTCANVIQYHDTDVNPGFVGIHCSLCETVPMSDEKRYEFADQLFHYVGTRLGLINLEKATGMHFDPHNIYILPAWHPQHLEAGDSLPAGLDARYC